MSDPQRDTPEALLALCRAGAVCPVCGVAPDLGAVRCPRHHRIAVPTSALAHREIAPLLGQLIADRYALIDCVGGGGMGVVYRGLDLRLDRVVAVKTLHGFMAAASDDRMRFEREARALSKLTGDHVVTIFDYGAVTEGPLTGLGYIVMALIEGESLEDRLARGAVLLGDTVAILEDVARALTEAHGVGIVHRDLKPSNILLSRTPDGREKAVVIDFGIARVHGSHKTSSGVIMGTPHYMAPEQCGGEGPLDARTDVYALGVMIYEMLTGAPPFDAPESLQILLKHMSAPPPPLPQTGSPWDGISAALQQAMAKDPAARHRSVMALVEELNVALGGATVVGPMPSAPEGAKTIASAGPPSGSGSQPDVGSSSGPHSGPHPGPITEAPVSLDAPSGGRWVIWAVSGGAVMGLIVAALWWALDAPPPIKAAPDAELVTVKIGGALPGPVSAPPEAQIADGGATDAGPDAGPAEAPGDVADEGVADAPDAAPRRVSPSRGEARKRRGRRGRRRGARSAPRPAPRPAAQPKPAAEDKPPLPSAPPSSDAPPSKPLIQPLIQPLIDE